jgi:hypothetical protein
MVRVRAAVRTDGAAARQPFEGAILFIKALDAKGATLELGSSAEQPIASKDWSTHEVSCRVPSRAATIRYGLSVEGPVRAWLDDVVVENVE